VLSSDSRDDEEMMRNDGRIPELRGEALSLKPHAIAPSRAPWLDCGTDGWAVNSIDVALIDSKGVHAIGKSHLN
jgi:hypothetical protein